MYSAGPCCEYEISLVPLGRADMTGRHARLTVSPLRATLFAVGVSLALIFVIFPTESDLHTEDVAATVIISLIAGGVLGVHVYMFQPRELNTALRLFMLALLIVVWVAAAKFFLSATLAVPVAPVLPTLAAFAGYSQPDARASLSQHPLDALQMATTFLMGGLVGIFAVHRAERLNRYLVGGGVRTSR